MRDWELSVLVPQGPVCQFPAAPTPNSHDKNAMTKVRVQRRTSRGGARGQRLKEGVGREAKEREGVKQGTTSEGARSDCSKTESSVVKGGLGAKCSCDCRAQRFTCVESGRLAKSRALIVAPRPYWQPVLAAYLCIQSRQ